MQTLLIARNPEEDSSLPYIVRIPLGEGIVLRVKDTWPRTSKIYCHPHGEGWPEDADIVEERAVRGVEILNRPLLTPKIQSRMMG